MSLDAANQEAASRFVIAAGGGWLAFPPIGDLFYVFAAVAAGAWFGKPLR